MKKLFALIIITMLVVGLIPINVFATNQDKPDNVRVKTVDGKPSIGYDNSPSKLGYYADLEWDQPVFKEENGHYKVFYKPDGGDYIQYGLSLDEGITEVRISQLNAGTLYHAYVRAYHEHLNTEDPYLGEIHGSDYNELLDQVLFLTNIELETVPISEDEIQIIWKDVLYNQERIGYKIYISESNNFENIRPIEIEAADIGEEKMVIPYSQGNLSYTFNNLKPATIYNIKIEPVIRDLKVALFPEEKVVTSNTLIPARMEKYSQGDDYDVWKMQWSVITSSIALTEDIEYEIYKRKENEPWKSIGGQREAVRYIKDYKDEEVNYFYKVRVYIEGKYNEFGEQYYIESNEVSVYFVESPYNPSIPELIVSVPKNEDETMDITSDSIEIIWEIPLDSEGNIDTEIFYDLWLVDNPDMLSELEPIENDFKPLLSNYIFEKVEDTLTNNVIAYKYTFNDLESNTVYYCKVVANKKFTVLENEQVIIKTFSSDPFVKTVKTETENSSIPISPQKPPFRIKVDEYGERCITKEAVTIQWDTGWEEYYTDEGSWDLITEDNADTVAENVYSKRTIIYEPDIRFAIGYMELVDDINYNDLRTAATQIIDIENPFSEGTSGTLEYTIQDLEQNKTYLIWLRAYRDSDLMSEPSEPLIITTKPGYIIPLEKPAAPKINYTNSLPNNRGIELGWDRSVERNDIEYTYYLKWSNIDDINTALEPAEEITKEYFLLNDIYKIEDLEPETTYYFWLQVGLARGENEKEISEWGNSEAVRTTQYVSPIPPTGFGIKGDKNALGPHYITYEWNASKDFTYVLEVADNLDFVNLQEYNTSDSEYKVDNLNSNSWYYARLYVYDEEKDLLSIPTEAIMIKTLISHDEYDSDVDNNTVISGPLEEDTYDSYGDVWIKKIIGVNGDRILEDIINNDKSVYEINFEEPPDSFGDVDSKRLVIAYKVFSGLDDLKKDLLIMNGKKGNYFIRPGMLKIEKMGEYFDTAEGVNVDIEIIDNVNNDDIYNLNINHIELLEISIVLSNDEISVPVEKLNRPLKVDMPIKDAYIYSDNMTGAILSHANWETLSSEVKVSSNGKDGIISFDTTLTGVIGVVSKNINMRFSDLTYHWAKKEILELFENYDIKSLDEDAMLFPDQSMKKGDFNKMIFDILNVEYTNNNIMELSYKAGFGNLSSQNSKITKQEIAKMLTRVYEIKTGLKAKGVNGILKQFDDSYKVADEYRDYVEFAIRKGLILADSESILGPTDLVTRAESIVMLKNTLEKSGDL